MKKFLIASAVLAAAAVATPAAAQQQSLTVNGTVASYCDIRLANVSSGTATIAFTDIQKVANLQLACNQGTGTRLQVNPQNGDLTNSAGRINYAFELRSPSDSAFAIGLRDTAPGDAENIGLFTRNRPNYSQAIANGIPLELWMNVNVSDTSIVDQPDLSGTPLFPANAAPAGTYVEVFNFNVSAI